MINHDEDALICDLAETYHIYEYRQLPPLKVAVFSCGLRNDSRVKMSMAGQNVALDTLILAKIADNTSLSVWGNTNDGLKGKNRPESITKMLIDGEESKSNSDQITFTSGEEFEKARNEILKGGGA